MNRHTMSNVHGFLFGTMLTGFTQDFMGLEMYLAYVREDWVDTSYWWWVVGMIILTGVMAFHRRWA